MISVIGHFGKNKTLLNGQTVKTKIITEALREYFGNDSVVTYDTYGGVKTLLKAPFQVYSAIKNSSDVIIFPAHNGVRIYAPLLILLKKILKSRKIHYVVIGGWLPEFLKNKVCLANSLKQFDGIYVETNTMKLALESMGFINIYLMPNCKKIPILSEDELVYPVGKPYRLCTFSRVMQEKGIEDAVRAVNAVNESMGQTVFSLDIYGQVDGKQTEWFDELHKTFPDYIHYGGLVPFDKSVETLKEYFSLLFPTYYEGEGFAGTLIDAYSAGVPVVASDWKYNVELVNENVGYLYEAHNNVALAKILVMLAKNPDLMIQKKSNCLNEAKKYELDQVVKVLINQIATK